MRYLITLCLVLALTGCRTVEANDELDELPVATDFVNIERTAPWVLSGSAPPFIDYRFVGADGQDYLMLAIYPRTHKVTSAPDSGDPLGTMVVEMDRTSLASSAANRIDLELEVAAADSLRMLSIPYTYVDLYLSSDQRKP